MINYNNLLDPTTQDYLTFQEPFTFSDKEDSLEPAAKKKKLINLDRTLAVEDRRIYL